jgi:hypothetical protein
MFVTKSLMIYLSIVAWFPKRSSLSFSLSLFHMFSLFCNVSHDCFFIDLFRHLAVRYTFYSSSIQSLSFFFFLTAVFLLCLSSFCLGLYHCCFLFLSVSMFVTQPLGLCVTVFRFLFTLSVFLSLAVSLILSFLQSVEFLL